MSRLDQIAAILGVSTDTARQFTRSVREHFDEAPSYAQLVEALRALPTNKPSAQQVAVEIKRKQAERDIKRAERTGKPAPSAKKPSAKKPAAKRRGEKPKRPTSLHHKQRYGRKKPTEQKQDE